MTKKIDTVTPYAYAYNYDNLMTSYDGPGTDNDTTYTYDVGLKRIKKDVNETVTKFIYDGPNVVAEYNGSNDLQASHIIPGVDQNLTIKQLDFEFEGAASNVVLPGLEEYEVVAFNFEAEGTGD